MRRRQGKSLLNKKIRIGLRVCKSNWTSYKIMPLKVRAITAFFQYCPLSPSPFHLEPSNHLPPSPQRNLLTTGKLLLDYSVFPLTCFQSPVFQVILHSAINLYFRPAALIISLCFPPTLPKRPSVCCIKCNPLIIGFEVFHQTGSSLVPFHRVVNQR